MSYSFNATLENKSLADLADAARVIMIYEGKDQKFAFRHNNQTLTNVLFADGHVRTCTQARLEAAIKNGDVRWKP